MEYEKNYSLLRPFDIEAAKSGDSVISIISPECEGTFVGGPDCNGVIVLNRNLLGFSFWEPTEQSESLRMAPLAWVEGKPVYKGDVVWNTGGDKSPITAERSDGNWIFGTCELDGIGSSSQCDELTWIQPKEAKKPITVSEHAVIEANQEPVQMLWNVWAFGKVAQQVTSPVDWDAENVRQWLINRGWSDGIEVALSKPVWRAAQEDMILQDWSIARRPMPPFNRIEIKAPNGYVAVVDQLDSNPANVLYLLADALLTTMEE